MPGFSDWGEPRYSTTLAAICGELRNRTPPAADNFAAAIRNAAGQGRRQRLLVAHGGSRIKSSARRVVRRGAFVAATVIAIAVPSGLRDQRLGLGRRARRLRRQRPRRARARPCPPRARPGQALDRRPRAGPGRSAPAGRRPPARSCAPRSAPRACSSSTRSPARHASSAASTASSPLPATRSRRRTSRSATRASTPRRSASLASDLAGLRLTRNYTDTSGITHLIWAQSSAGWRRSRTGSTRTSPRTGG